MSRLRAALIGSVVGLLAVGCASFPEQPPPAGWSEQVQLTPQAGPRPELPGELPQSPGQAQQGQSPPSVPPPQGCKDFNPLVIATCLNPVSGVAMTDVTQAGVVTALATERTTGRLLRVTKDVDPVVLHTIAVDAASDGGLTGLTLSPTYPEDQLVYVYATTATDNRVLRIAPGDAPKPILTGIPKGPSGNRGVLAYDRTGALLVATGDAGNPALAANPESLAGKVLRIDGAGQPAPGNPTPGSRVYASGLRSPAGLCVSGDGSKTWVTDAGETADLLYRVEAGKALTSAAWSWPDKPGITGCASLSDVMWVATANAPGTQFLPMNQDGSFTGKPEPSHQGEDGFGRIGALVALDDRTALIGTVNKAPGGAPVSSDDRVAILIRPESAGSKD
ncbi:PQQ-dependent sugar dehydrogenase [Saccharothrix coeruleofusca]|uniref:Glucose dehydrogenase n=1 Tax=Saccharothrix coeruleofusca TaxID=33919 RepID=A0A918AIL9_9PSEU|nr:PQQ-dependent sugar dehydrogenase [Saccharothrix coeruleofusca]MBP2338640.1 glucose/arabinose dehydrogenase [Saccharothrix coeruleofusca]GGP47000.1 glucose dehydrogenase [Saccharothrix coeruleofusca]